MPGDAGSAGAKQREQATGEDRGDRLRVLARLCTMPMSCIAPSPFKTCVNSALIVTALRAGPRGSSLSSLCGTQKYALVSDERVGDRS